MTAVIIQCRLSSTRLPCKAMMDLGGMPLAAWTMRAMKKVAAVSYVLATDEASAESLRPIADSCGYEVIVGPLDDVLERFCIAIRQTNCDTVVRATADNPFLFYEAAQSLLGEYNRLNEGGGFDTNVASQRSLNRQSTVEPVDYITYTGLPHGSGVEVMRAEALLKALEGAAAYDREHVGPALYNHKDKFKCVMLPSPARFNHPELRTTVDTATDLRRAHLVVREVERGRGRFDGSDTPLRGTDHTANAPYTTEQILNALSAPAVSHPVLFAPSIAAGQGTGHLVRCAEAAAKLGGFVLIAMDGGEKDSNSVEHDGEQQPLLPPVTIHSILDAAGLEPWQVIADKTVVECSTPQSGGYAIVVADRFRLSAEDAEAFHRAAPLVSIDDGGSATDFCDCLIDIIPSALDRRANITDPGLMTPPSRVRQSASGKRQAASGEGAGADIKNVLVCFGGEDPASLTMRVSQAVKEALPHTEVTEITAYVPNLRDKLADYDLVVTHYGLTAYEARRAGCAVLLFASTPLHEKLSAKYGFVCLGKEDVKAEKIREAVSRLGGGFDGFDTPPLHTTGGATEPPAILSKGVPRYTAATVVTAAALGKHDIAAKSLNHQSSGQSVVECSTAQAVECIETTLPALIRRASYGRRLPCPICGDSSAISSPVAERASKRTYRRCSKCGMLYMAWTMESESRYDADYFGEQYKKQYGRTYLEDFDAIKAQGARRVGVLNAIIGRRGAPAIAREKFETASASRRGTLLDVGCAYGPFLAAARDEGWEVFGTDVSYDAVQYVHSSLLFPAAMARFPSFDPAAEFGISQFDAVTMWYVIEHFGDLDSVLQLLSRITKPGGVFAFSTPSGEGVSAKSGKAKFFEDSPADHHTIWEPSRAASILKRYGFKVERIVSTGHHAERFPVVKRHGWSAAHPMYKAIERASRILRLGDTCEVYCKRAGE